ncbi:alanyl-tRNA editing protein [Candidatus Bathyarchaeota archaeon]|nr:MAG: alanyl-tRNA editing protein [Candidatus Bathyarchaeota archaeon]
MTRKLYWDEPYSRKFTATVEELDGNNVVLDRTLFYPRGGGVSCDIGTLGGTSVVETIRSEDKILHSLTFVPSFGKGQSVHGELDWERRHRLMRMHTAGHLLSAILYTKVNARITGNQIDVDRSRMDFNLEAFDRAQIEGFVQEANSLIQKDAAVKTYFMEREEALKRPELVKLAEAFPPAEKQLRIVEIEGIDKQADGGLHVQKLSEIGTIQLLKLENKGKTNRRLYYDLQ